jgi:hypothetical protein
MFFFVCKLHTIEYLFSKLEQILTHLGVFKTTLELGETHKFGIPVTSFFPHLYEFVWVFGFSAILRSRVTLSIIIVIS